MSKDLINFPPSDFIIEKFINKVVDFPLANRKIKIAIVNPLINLIISMVYSS